MSHSRIVRSISALLGTAILPLVMACTHSSAPPTAPTSSAGPASPSGVSGGTISGTVVATTAAQRALLGTPRLAQSIAGTLTVTVTGTGNSAAVDVNGHFTLNNVAAGHVDLHFTGNGVDAHLALDGVADHKTLVITVHVSGTDAQLEDQHNENDQGGDHTGSTQVELSGAIAAGTLAGSCAGNNLSFMIGTTKVDTNATTKFEDGSCASLKAGSRVEVTGTRQSDNSVLATTVSVEGNDGRGGESGHNDSSGNDLSLK